MWVNPADEVGEVAFGAVEDDRARRYARGRSLRLEVDLIREGFAGRKAGDGEIDIVCSVSAITGFCALCKGAISIGGVG